ERALTPFSLWRRALSSLSLILSSSSTYYAPPSSNSPRATAHALARAQTPLFQTASGLSVNKSRPLARGRPRTSTPRLICRLAQNRRKIKEEDEPGGWRRWRLVKTVSNRAG